MKKRMFLLAILFITIASLLFVYIEFIYSPSNNHHEFKSNEFNEFHANQDLLYSLGKLLYTIAGIMLIIGFVVKPSKQTSKNKSDSNNNEKKLNKIVIYASEIDLIEQSTPFVIFEDYDISKNQFDIDGNMWHEYSGEIISKDISKWFGYAAGQDFNDTIYIMGKLKILRNWINQKIEEGHDVFSYRVE